MNNYILTELDDTKILSALREASLLYENGCLMETRDILQEIINAIDEYSEV